MKNLIEAMTEEKAYVVDRLSGISTSLPDRLIKHGYCDLTEYFKDKKQYMFEQWKPEVFYVEASTLTTELENAIRDEKYGVYISVHDGLYAFHGSDEIDYDLCEKLGVCVAELFHKGGTIIGSGEDLGIWICAPSDLQMSSSEIIGKIHEIIAKYVPDAVVAGNDILVNGEKVMGSMSRSVGKVFIWAAQVSFGEYSDIITQVCNKQSVKKPSHIDSALLTRDILEREVLSWLCKR